MIMIMMLVPVVVYIIVTSVHSISIQFFDENLNLSESFEAPKSV